MNLVTGGDECYQSRQAIRRDVRCRRLADARQAVRGEPTHAAPLRCRSLVQTQADEKIHRNEATSGESNRFDEAGVSAAVDADDDFRDFVVAQSRSLLAFAWMLTYDAGRAEDLLQTSLAKTWLHWSRLRKDSDPSAYVRRVMVNTAGAWWRRRWRGEVPTAGLPETTDVDAYAVSDDREVLVRALSELPRRQRAVVVLRYYEGLSEAETAELLGCSVGTVKSQAARGLARLRSVDSLAQPAKEWR